MQPNANKNRVYFQNPLSQINHTHDERHNNSNSNSTQSTSSRTISNIDLLVRQLQSRNPLLERALINISIPAVLIEALGTSIRNCGFGPEERTGKNSAANASRPIGVKSSVTLGGELVAIGHEGVTLGVVVRGVEGGHVRRINVWAVG